MLEVLAHIKDLLPFNSVIRIKKFRLGNTRRSIQCNFFVKLSTEPFFCKGEQSCMRSYLVCHAFWLNASTAMAVIPESDPPPPLHKRFVFLAGEGCLMTFPVNALGRIEEKWVFVFLQCYKSSKTLLEHHCDIWWGLLVFLLELNRREQCEHGFSSHSFLGCLLIGQTSLQFILGFSL